MADDVKGTHHTAKWSYRSKYFQTDLIVEIYSKSLVRATGKVLHMKFSQNTNQTHKGDEKWPLCINKQLFWWSTAIKLDNKNDVLTDF